MSKDLTLSEIKNKFDDGDISISPDYQRDYIYDNMKASRLIESFMIGIPIPPVYLCEEDDGIWDVIDGQQRIQSIINYLSNKFSLKGLEVLKDLNGKSYKDLEKPHQRKLKSSSLSAIVVKKESKALKFEIFARLNQGSVELNDQELRNCIYRGPFNKMLNELSEIKAVKNLFPVENNRKKYQSLILRFFALRNYVIYKETMKRSMNEYMESHRNDSDEKLAEHKNLFVTTLNMVKIILGPEAFFGVDRVKRELKKTFSPTVYDSIMIAFSLFHQNDLIAHADEIRNYIIEVKLHNSSYHDFTFARSGDARCVKGRISIIIELLQEIVGKKNEYPESRVFSNEVKQQLFYNGYKCSFCGNEILNIDDAEVDHIKPWSKGGKTIIENAQLLHRHCNRIKNNSEL